MKDEFNSGIHNYDNTKPIEKDYRIVLTDQDREDLEDHLNEFEFFAYDVEATGLNVKKDTVIGFSVSGEIGKGFYFPIMTWNGEGLEMILDNMEKTKYFLELIATKELLMWNGSYDIRITKSNFDIDLTDSLAAEGMLLKHTVQEEGIFGLKETAIEIQDKIGLDVEEEANKEQIALKVNVEKNGGTLNKTNYELYKADLDVMGPYAAADADLTLRICLYYLDLVEEEGLEEFYFDEEVMPLYKEVTIPMEDRGVLIDMELIQQSKEEIEKDIDLLEEEVIAALFKEEEIRQWLNTKIEESYKVSPKGKFGQEVADFFNLDLPKSIKTGKFSLTKKNLESLPYSEERDFLLGYQELSEETYFAIKHSLYHKENDKQINISSKKQMGEIIFDFFNIEPLSKTKKGAPQFNADFVEHLVTLGLEWADKLLDYNKLIKIRGAYIDRFLENHIDGRYYFSYKQHGTISGRYGSDAQQLPRPMEEGQVSEVVLKYVNRIRKFFISEDDRIFIDSDYESLEPHVFAHVSGDEGLRDIFRKGHDFYSTIAIATEGLYEYSADKTADNYLGKMDKQKRQQAKAYSLGVPYGMTGYALGKALEIHKDEAEELREAYLESYPELKKWMEESEDMAQTKGYVKSQSGRIRHLPKVKELHKIHKNKLLSFIYRNKIQKRYDKEEVFNMYMDYKNGINNAKNFQIQSLSASIVNRAAIAINRKFKELKIDGWCCAQVHDQLIFNVPEDKSEECMKIVQDLMENTTKLSLKLKAPPQLGRNWGESH